MAILVLVVMVMVVLIILVMSMLSTSLCREKCGGCVSHARQCSADTGVFLRVRECLVVFHSKVNRGTFLPAPYLDEYGEADKVARLGYL